MLKKILIAIPLLLLLAIIGIVGASTMEHRRLVAQEKKAHPAPGQLVDVHGDGSKIHVLAKGQGEKTLVFLSGLGTPSPTYDFKVLTDDLSKSYRTVVVERPGYGWSDVTDHPRDLDTVLGETRKALELAGIKPPYVLFPHSLAGLEAIYWAAQHPDEVDLIIGLDPLIPGYKDPSPTTFSPMIDFLMGTGLVRNQPSVFNDNFLAMKKGHLSEEEADVARTLFYRRVQTQNMKEELALVDENTKLVPLQKEVPFYSFVSTRNEDPKWVKSLEGYTKSTGGQAFLLDAHHYVHLDEPDAIIGKSKALIDGN